MNQQSSPTSNAKCIFICPITGFKFSLNLRFIIATLIMIVWANLFAWFWHTTVLGAKYQATASLWRAPAEMKQGAIHGGIVLMSFIATYIFIKGYEGTGWREGLRFGIIITLLLFGLGLITYAIQPIPFTIIGMWSLGDLISYSVGGIFLSVFIGKCPRNS